MNKLITIKAICLALLVSFGAKSQDLVNSSDIVTNISLDSFKVEGVVVPRPDDILWSKSVWRIVDLREKVNHVLYFPERKTDDRVNLITLILEGVFNDPNIKLYDLVTNEIMNEESEKSSSKVYEDLYAWNSSFMAPADSIDRNKIRLYDAGTGDSVYLKPDYEMIGSKVLKFYLKEVWYFDKVESEMKSRITAICPVVTRLMQSGNEIEVQLGWVPFLDLKPYLVKQSIVTSSKNDSKRMSYADFFAMRRFSSYIYKESNIYNRKITDYCYTIEEAHAEQERIKNEILNFEQDLWEY